MASSKQRAVALCRVSTSKQRIYGNSLEAQEKRILDAASSLDLDLPDEYIWRMDISSRKGKNIKRKDLLQIFDVCKKDKRVKVFIIDEPDRFMRSIAEYYWWKIEYKQIGVKLVFANNPHVDDDSQGHIFNELIDVFRAESSNQERIRKANEKMQSRIDLGYYPGYLHTGYMKSDTPGIHIPGPGFNELQEAYKNIAAGKFDLHEALAWLANVGFTIKGGKKLDMTKLKRILKEPYYYGAVSMGNFKINEHGLHEPMVTKEEFEIASLIAHGKKARFTVNRHNPEFPMNGLLCEVCFFEKKDRTGKFTGYTHHNGKRPGVRRYYDRYRCRGCNMPFTRDELHKVINNFLGKITIPLDVHDELVTSLRKAWLGIQQDNQRQSTQLRTRLSQANDEKLKLVSSLAENPDLQEDLREAIKIKKAQITTIEDELSKLQDIESDFDEFVIFSLEFCDNLKKNWWTLDHDDRVRCEQLLFPELLRINSKRKVSTPVISSVYRYKTNQKAPVGALVDNSGGPGET